MWKKSRMQWHFIDVQREPIGLARVEDDAGDRRGRPRSPNAFSGNSARVGGRTFALNDVNARRRLVGRG